MNTLPPLVRLSKEDSLFIEKMGSSCNGQWFTVPQIFQKVGNDIYRIWVFSNLPDEIKELVDPIITNAKSQTNEHPMGKYKVQSK